MIEIKDAAAHNQLVKVVSQAPNKNWIDEYLDLIKELLDFTGLKDGDERLVISLPISNKKIPVTINRRYVLVAFLNTEPVTGFIFPSDWEQNLQIEPVYAEPYKPQSKDEEIQIPYEIRFQGSPKDLLTPEQKKAWIDAVISEVERGEVSPYRKHHVSAVYQAAVDPLYKSLVLYQAFASL